MRVGFWAHQLIEYVLGLVLIAQAVQGDTMVPAVVAGAVLLVAAATVDGPLAGWKAMSRPTHRIVDLVVGGGMLAFAVLPGTGFDPLARLFLGIFGAGVLLLSLRTNYAPSRPWTRPDSEAVGRAAGRAVGRKVSSYKRRSDRPAAPPPPVE